MKPSLFLLFLIFFTAKSYDYTILVLPCGGATAVISASLLQHLEEKTGQPTNKMFDEIWGSSAGSIIAALLTTKPHPLKAQDIVKFFNQNFANYYNGYHICNTLKELIGTNSMISDTIIPVRILTAAARNPTPNKWELYDFSSDGAGSCTDTKVSLAAAVKSSCTVYPYLYLRPEKIKIHNKEYVYCIDSGSLCCGNLTTIDPTAYFLEQKLQHLKAKDTLTIYFLCTAFTPTMDQQKIECVLQKYPQFASAVNCHVISMPSTCDQIMKKYIEKSSTAVKLKIKFLVAFLAKIVGQENANANLLATGTIPLSELIQEAQIIIKESKDFKIMIGMLQTSSKLITAYKFF